MTKQNVDLVGHLDVWKQFKIGFASTRTVPFKSRSLLKMKLVALLATVAKVVIQGLLGNTLSIRAW